MQHGEFKIVTDGMTDRGAFIVGQHKRRSVCSKEREQINPSREIVLVSRSWAVTSSNTQMQGVQRKTPGATLMARGKYIAVNG